MRDRLTKMIEQKQVYGIDQEQPHTHEIVLLDNDELADHLLANGVIVPPVKIGQTVYVINTLFVSEYRVEALWWNGLMFIFKGENDDYADECSVFYFFDERIGKTVFLTREEAEKALAEREGKEWRRS